MSNSQYAVWNIFSLYCLRWRSRWNQKSKIPKYISHNLVSLTFQNKFWHCLILEGSCTYFKLSFDSNTTGWKPRLHNLDHSTNNLQLKVTWLLISTCKQGKFQSQKEKQKLQICKQIIWHYQKSKQIFEIEPALLHSTLYFSEPKIKKLQICLIISL